MCKLPVDYTIGELFSSETRECKLKVIEDIDNPTIDQFVSKNFKEKRSLTYFGLAGANLTDLIHWKEYLKRGVSVEVKTNVYHQQIRSLFSRKLSDEFEFSKDIAVIQGDIDDLFDTSKENSLGKNPVIDSFLPFTLINLDYYGTVIGASITGIMRRIKLLRNFFEIQWKKDNQLRYLLLLTVYHAGMDKEPETRDSQLEKIIVEYAGDKYKDISNKVIKTGKRIPILSFGVPLFIAEVAKASQTSLRILKRVTYRDSKYSMLHFIFELEGQRQQSPWVKKKNIFKEAPLLRGRKISDGKVEIKNYWDE